VSIATQRASNLDRVQLQPGQIWSLAKDGWTLTCVLYEHPDAGWEHKLEFNGKLLRSDACADIAKVWKLTDRWRDRAAEKGWAAPT
jgi:hypothetical protein